MANRYARTGRIIECLVCSVDIYIEPNQEGRKKFCSKKCLYASGIQTKTFTKGHKDLVPQSSRGHSEETKVKISITQRQKNPKPDDMKKGKRNMLSWKYKAWRVAVFQRDNYTCQICFQYSGVLHADHIQGWADNPDLRYSVYNGRTLCVACHYYVTFKRKMLVGVRWCNYTHRERG